LLVFGATLVLYRWPTWTRNIPALTGEEGRVIYTAGNIDVSVGSFIVQECQAALACGLIVILWTQWTAFLEYWRARISEVWVLVESGKRTSDFLESLTLLFLHWQVCSIVLAGAFLPYTFYFWTYVIDHKDRRYLAHAVIMHGLWGASWILMSLPLAWTWYRWRVRYRLSTKPSKQRPVPYEAEQGRESVETPISSLNVLGSLLGAVVTFGLPLLKELFAH
jgi:hypothetical protein